MDDSATDLALVIGQRVRAERKSRGWTLDQLAMAADVSRRMVVSVEQGAANPSVGTLLRLGDALGVGLPALVEPSASRPVKVTRDGAGALLWRGAAGGHATLLISTEAPDIVELWDWTLGPGDAHGSEPHAPGTRELLQVLAGEILLGVGDQDLTLAVGDGACFYGDVPHRYSNPTRQAARFSLAVYEPGVGRLDPHGGAA